METNTDKKIATADTNPANSPRKMSPYERYPERAVWSVFETWERPDGTRYVKTYECARWAGTFADPVLVSTKELVAPLTTGV